jgi:hypothetical protein
VNYVRHEDTITMKCSYCEKYRMSGPWGLGNGCTTLQHNALVTHEKSLVHKDAKGRWINELERKMKPIPDHIRQMEDENKERVITTMKISYFVAKKIYLYQSMKNFANFSWMQKHHICQSLKITLHTRIISLQMILYIAYQDILSRFRQKICWKVLSFH